MGRKPFVASEFAARVNEATEAATEDVPPSVAVAASFAPFTLEELFTAEWGSRIDTATNCQLAICRLLEGRPIGELWLDEKVRLMLGETLPELDGMRPKVAMVLSGIRTAKSTMIGDTAIHVTQTIELPEWVRPSDEVRIPIVSTDVDTAKATFSHVAETILSSPRLTALLSVDDKGKTIEPKTDSLLLRHPSGRDIEVKVVALSRAGSTLTARWFASAIFDEAPRMGGEVDYVRSFDEAFRACRGRILPGGVIMLGGSPHARIGPVYDLFRKHFGKPKKGFVVVKARAPWLNPVYWTPERCAELKEDDPIAHQTDVECEFKDPESSLGDSASIEGAMRAEPGDIAPVRLRHYVATMDPATRVNAWTFGIVENIGLKGANLAYRVAFNCQWVPEPGRTLSPDTVLGEVADKCRLYGITEVFTDIASADAITDIAATKNVHPKATKSERDTAEPFTPLGINVETSVDLLELGRDLMTLIRRGLFELPCDGRMREDLQSVRTRTSTNGNVSILLPKSAGGRHCDYFPMLCLAVKNPPEPPDIETHKTLDQEDLERELEECRKRNEDHGNFESEANAFG
jgi:hypothetical protein